MSDRTIRCPNCGAPHAPGDRFCATCGYALPGSAPAEHAATQPTMPFTPLGSSDRPDRADQSTWASSDNAPGWNPQRFPIAAAKPLEESSGTASSWTSPPQSPSSASTRSAWPTSSSPPALPRVPPAAFEPAGAVPAYLPAAAPPRRGRLAGCVMALVAFVLICVVAAVLAWLVGGRGYVRDRARAELRNAAATQVSQIPPLTVPSGTLTVTEAQINDELRSNPDSYAPLSNPKVTIAPDHIRLGFNLMGLSSTYDGQLAAQNGRLVVVNPTVNGPAGQVLQASDVSTVVEEQLNALLDRSGLRATGVQLRNGALSISTVPVAGR